MARRQNHFTTQKFRLKSFDSKVLTQSFSADGPNGLPVQPGILRIEHPAPKLWPDFNRIAYGIANEIAGRWISLGASNKLR